MASETTHSALQELRDDPDRLIEIILQQAETIRELREKIDQLEASNAHLRERLEKSERAGKRQAAPFRRSEKKRAEEPAEPGRKEGHEGTHRCVPEEIDHHVEVDLESCPHCGSDQIEAPRPLVQYIEEVPRVAVETTELTTYRGRCPHCGPVESSHPLKTSGAVGAAGVQLGPRAKAVATSLAYEHGLTLRSACRVLKRLFGLTLSPGGLSQLAHRTASELEAKEAQLLEEARAASVQHVDETSWHVAGADPERMPYWLWVFADVERTIYRVDHRRNRQVVQETLGADFSGVLVSDCLNIYETLACRQQKCYAHHFKAISEAEGEHSALGAGPSAYLERLKGLLRGAQALKAVEEDLPEAMRCEHREALERHADKLLAPGRPRSDLTDPEQYVRNRLWKQRDRLFVFLDHEAVDATNNLAERRLRPAIIQRKLSCGNETERGARTWEILASLAATYVQQGRSFVELVMKAASFTPEPVPAR